MSCKATNKKKGRKEMSITLKAARINAGYSLSKAAKELDITTRTLMNWEKGSSFPTVPQITVIEKLYGIPYNQIIFLPQHVGLNEKDDE